MATKAVGQNGKNAAGRVAGVVASLSILAPFVASLLYVRAYGVDVFFAHEWDFVARLREATRGTLGVGGLFAHHNEHAYFSPGA